MLNTPTGEGQMAGRLSAAAGVHQAPGGSKTAKQDGKYGWKMLRQNCKANAKEAIQKKWMHSRNYPEYTEVLSLSTKTIKKSKTKKRGGRLLA